MSSIFITPLRAWPVVVLLWASAGLALPAQAGPLRGDEPRIRLTREGPVRPGDRVEFEFDGDMSGIREFEILISIDGGRTFDRRISEELEPGTRRFDWRVPDFECPEIQLRLQFNRDGREIESEAIVRLRLAASGGASSGAATVPSAVEADGPVSPARRSGETRPGGNDGGAGDRVDGPQLDQRSPAGRAHPAPDSQFLHNAPCGPAVPPGAGAAPLFVPPRK